MTQKEIDIYSSIQGAFVEFYNIARLGLKKRWKSLTQKERVAAARSLVFMRELATNPAKYFSRANTGADWAKRAYDYAQAHGIKDVYHAYYIVPAPTDVVYEKAGAAWICNPESYKVFYRFCLDVQNWEYGRTSEQNSERYLADVLSESIVKTAKICAAVRKANEPNKAQQFIQRKFKSLSK